MMPQHRPRTRRFVPLDMDESHDKLTAYCLMQDVSYGLTPSLMRDEARVQIEYSNIDRASVTACFDHARTIETFIDQVGSTIVRSGRHAFEILDIDAGPFALSSIMPGTWRTSGDRLVQRIPRLENVDDTPFVAVLEPGEFYVLKSQHLTPKVLGKMWKRIRRLDESLEASHTPEAYRSLGKERTALSIAILKATAAIGWPVRPGLSNMTEHYAAYRTLRFHKALAGLREEVVAFMNAALKRFGDRRGFQAAVTISGLKSPQDFDVDMDDLLAGRIAPGSIRYW